MYFINMYILHIKLLKETSEIFDHENILNRILISHLDIRSSSNFPPKKLHLSMRVWVQSPGSLQNISVCEFRLKFLSYIYIYI